MEDNKTSISIGANIRRAIMGDAYLGATLTDCYPLVGDASTLPYVVYGCIGMGERVIKGGVYMDTSNVQVICYAAGYDETLEIAEAVRRVLEDCDDFHRVTLVNRKEAYDADCFIQELTFSIVTH